MNYLQHLTHHGLTDRLKRPPGIPASECQGMLIVDTTFDDDRPIIQACGECLKPKESDVPLIQIYYCRECGQTVVVERYGETEKLVNEWKKIMSFSEFARLVQAMRSTQKAYFAARHHGEAAAEELEASKALERKVDKACEELVAGQPTLFDWDSDVRTH